MEQEVAEIFQSILQELVVTIQQILIAQGLDKNSNLVKSIDVNWDIRNKEMQLIAADYYEYVNYGRKPGVKKVPISVLINWIRKKKIKGRSRKTGRFITVNSLAYAIQNSIYKTGIRGKNYITKVNAAMDAAVETVLDDDDFLKALLFEFDKNFR
jgi:hypothetical protein